MESMGLGDNIIGTDEEDLCLRLMEKIEYIEKNREKVISQFNEARGYTKRMVEDLFEEKMKVLENK